MAVRPRLVLRLHKKRLGEEKDTGQILVGKILAYFMPTGGDSMKYRVKLEKTDEGYAVWCPGLPGCWSQGTTEEEALENIKDAIETYLATIEELTKDKTTRVVEVSA